MNDEDQKLLNDFVHMMDRQIDAGEPWHYAITLYNELSPRWTDVQQRWVNDN